MIPHSDNFPQDLVDDTIAALLAQPGAKQSENSILCCSPFRQERRASFSFSVEKLCGYDFATGAGYGLIETARALGIEPADYQHAAGPRPPRQVRRALEVVPHVEAAAPPSRDWQAAARRALQGAQDALQQDAAMLDYLRHERLLTDDTIRAAGLGYNPRWLDLPGAGKLAPGIVLPYQQGGELWALRIRTFDHKLDKYLNAKGSRVSGTLYGGDRLAPGAPVLIVEGEFDCLLAQQDAGDTLAVVTLGPASNRLSPHWRAALESAPVIYLALDNDTAGRAAAAALAAALAGCDVRTLSYPDGVKDYTDYRRSGGTLAALLAPGRAWWPGGMPDVWRAQLQRTAGSAAVLAADTINRAVIAGALDSDCFTVAQVVEAAAALGEKAAHTLTRGIGRLAENEYFAILGIEDTDKNTMPKTAKYSSEARRGRGQPAKRYRLNPLSAARARLLQLAAPAIYQQMHPGAGDGATAAQWTGAMLAALDISPEAAADVNAALAPVWAAQGDTRHLWAAQRAAGALEELRRKLSADTTVTRPADGIDAAGTVGRAAAVLRAQVEAGAPPRSYNQLAADLGISRQSVPAVLRRAGIVQVEQTAQREVAGAADLTRAARRLAQSARGKVVNVLVESEGGTVEKLPYRGAASVETVARHLAAGRTVKLEARCASAQQAGPLPAAAPRPARIRTSAPRPARARTSAPKPAPAPAPIAGYAPAWLWGQLLLQARLAGLLRGGRIINRASGELIEVAGAPGWRLLEAITGLKLRGSTKYRLPAPAGYRLAQIEVTTGDMSHEQQVAS